MKIKRKRTIWSEADCVLLKDLYLVQKVPTSYIAELFKTDVEAVLRKTEKLKFSRKIKYELDHDYFTNMNTKSKWYILGMLSADGFLDSKNNRIGINLQLRDKAVIEFIKKELKFEGNILIKRAKPSRHIKGIRQDQAYMRFTSKQITKDLIKLGITDRKSLTLKFPEVPAEFISSYLLGYFDGDGCISKPAFTLLGTEDVCTNFEYNLRNLLNTTERKIYKRTTSSKNTLYVLNYTKKIDILKLYNFLYKEASFYMDRKYIKFTELVADIQDRNSKHIRNSYASILHDLLTRNLSPSYIIRKYGISRTGLYSLKCKYRTIEDFYAYNKQCIYE